MIHKLLTGYLTLALVIGQSLCCCSASLHAGTPHTSAAVKHHAPASDHGCCCKSEAAGECDTGSPSPSSQAPDQQHKCPCRDNAINAGPAAPSTVAPTALGPAAELPHVVPVAIATLQPVAIDATSLSERALDSIYPSGTEILRAFHVLRC